MTIIGPDVTLLPLSIGLFGPFEVRLHGAPLPRLRTRKGQWLLALLTLRAGSEVERSWLAGTLWPDSPQPQALGSLRMSLGDLRSALGPEADRLGSPSPHSLRLDLTGAHADVVAFDAAIAAGDEAALERGVTLYRGPLLEGCAEAWIFQERQAREQVYLGALESLAAQAMAVGDVTAAERHLRRAVAADPLRECAQRGLMQALTAGGNYAAALLAYRELRLLLHRELNAEPDPETTILFHQIRAEARQPVLWPERAARGTALTPQEEFRPLASRPASAPARRRPTHPLRGRVPPDASSPAGPGAFRFTDVESGTRLREDHPAIAPRTATSMRYPPGARRDDTLGARSHQLPAQPTPLLGREDEVCAARGLLLREEVRLVTLTGPAGTGKTRLGLQVATELIDSFASGVYFVSLAPIRDPTLVASAIAQTVGVREAGGQPLWEALKERLREKSLLLLLDNFEQVLKAAPLVAELLASCPRLKVLITSREVLRLRGEHEFLVPPLAAPDPKHLPPVAVVSRYAAVNLFVQRAMAVSRDFALTHENAPAVAEICHRLDGLPLAIELAAARIKLLSPQALLSRLGNRLKLLTGGARDLPARHQTLRGAIAWSYDLLEESERRLFRRLSVFVGGCTLEAAEAVCGAAGERESDFLDGVASLVDKSLLRREAGVSGEPRFTMLETIREFGRECLAASGEEEAIRRQHVRFFLESAERLWRERGVWWDWLEQELGNFRAALTWAVEQGEAEAGLRSASAVWFFFFQRGYLAEGRQRLAELLALPGAQIEAGKGSPALARTDEQPLAGGPRRSTLPEMRAKALCEVGILANAQGDYAAAQRYLEEALALRQESGDRMGVAEALLYLGQIASGKGDCAAARKLLEDALIEFRDLDQSCEVADTLCVLGAVVRLQGDYDRAREIYEESLQRYRALGQREHHAARELRNLGHVALFQGDVGRAEALFRESLTILRREGFKPPMPGSLAGMAGVRAALGQWERAAWLLGAAQALVEAMGAVWEPEEQAEYERHLAAARAALGEAAFAAAWAAGRTMTAEQAIIAALEPAPGM